MLLLTYGTRPEWIKIKPLIDCFKKNNAPHTVLFTGQHTMLSGEYYDIKISIEEITGNRLNDIVISILKNIDLKPFSHVLVQGDTTSALAIALSAYYNGNKVIHLEAGLRTYNLAHPYPEEANRQLISRISSINLCPTEISLKNLCLENLQDDVHNYVVGNTVLDNLKNFAPYYGNDVLITLHRRENIDIIKNWYNVINEIAKKHNGLNFIFPMHPNPKIRAHKGLLTHVKVIDPLNHDMLLDLINRCKIIITDSGGIQEEASFLNKKTLVCREKTERVESLGQSTFLVKTPPLLGNLFEEHVTHPEIFFKCPYGDGNSAIKIYDIFKKHNIFNETSK